MHNSEINWSYWSVQYTINHLSKIVDEIHYLVSNLSDCLDQDWCSVIVNGIESTICTQMKAQAECPVKCSSYLPNDDPCFTPGTNWNVECFSITDRASSNYVCKTDLFI